MNGVISLFTFKPSYTRLLLGKKSTLNLLHFRSISKKFPVYTLQPSKARLRFCSSQSSRDLPSCTSVSPPHTHTTQSESLFDHHISDIQILDPPTNCCMSGCANCVWIEYAKELASIYKDSDQAAEVVMKAIEDPSLKIFLNLELAEVLKK